MLKKLTKALFGNQSSSDPAPGAGRHQNRSQSNNKLQAMQLNLDGARVFERDEHCISRQDISSNAVKVLYKLNKEGYHGFLVGGGVRDLLLGGQPKDFDIATDATPEQLKQLFRNARIIGRRFMIVHLRFSREIIEVTTFRAPHEASNEFAANSLSRKIRHLDSAHSSSGMILRDNVYGNIDEDAKRRDLTINALYYTVDNFRVLDFCGGMDDLENRLIRIIGDPAERYKEDPVRILRVLRFAGKLDFDIEENTRLQINKYSHLLESVSSARLFDESIKLFTSGAALATFELVRNFGVGQYLFPETLHWLEQAEQNDQLQCSAKLLELALTNTDNRLAQGKSVTPAFLFAALLWPVLQQRLGKADKKSGGYFQQHQQAANAILAEQVQYTAIPKRFSYATREIWELQLRLQKGNRRSIDTTFAHPRFRAAYDFLLLREESGEDLNGMGKWWTDYQIANPDDQAQMLGEATQNSGATQRKRRRRPRKRKPAGSTE